MAALPGGILPSCHGLGPAENGAPVSANDLTMARKGPSWHSYLFKDTIGQTSQHASRPQACLMSWDMWDKRDERR